MQVNLRSIKSLEDIKFLYFKYKDSIGFTIGIVLLLIVITVIVFIKIVMPQANNWFSIQREVADTKSRIVLLRANQDAIAAMDDGVVSQQFTQATEALPYEKNYAGIVTAIDSATLASGMQRDDYSFSVGNLSTKSAQLAPNAAIPVKITLKGDSDQFLIFLQTIQKLFPLSEIVLAPLHAGTANIEINFFYKFQPENLQISYTDPLRSLTEKNKKLLLTLDEWRKATTSVTPSLNQDQVSSGSAL